MTNTYGISRRLGVAYGMGDTNWSVTASAFGRELTRNQAHGSGYGARGTWAPINETGNVLHFGLSYLPTTPTTIPCACAHVRTPTWPPFA